MGTGGVGMIVGECHNYGRDFTDDDMALLSSLIIDPKR